MANYRADRVESEILRFVSSFVQRELKDPRVDGVTVTDVDLTGDLQNATVYYTTHSDKASAREDAQKGLDKATGLVRRELGKILTLYKTPEIVFKRDESDDYGRHIDEIFRKINQND